MMSVYYDVCIIIISSLVTAADQQQHACNTIRAASAMRWLSHQQQQAS